MLDRQLISIGAEMRDDLGNWLTKRRRNIDKQERQAQKILRDCGIPEVELRKQWKDQRAAQLSLRARKFHFNSLADSAHLSTQMLPLD